MGYYTSFELIFKGPSMDDICKKAVELFGDRSYLPDLGHYQSLADGTEHWGIYAKWSNYQEEMLLLSEHFSGTLFTLRGDGDESGDMWVAYFKDGGTVHHVAEIVYPDFHEEDLKPHLGELTHRILFTRFERNKHGTTNVFNDNVYVGAFFSEARTVSDFEHECENYSLEGGTN